VNVFSVLGTIAYIHGEAGRDMDLQFDCCPHHEWSENTSQIYLTCRRYGTLYLPTRVLLLPEFKLALAIVSSPYLLVVIDDPNHRVPIYQPLMI
jgi:hypothetical protein